MPHSRRRFSEFRVGFQLWDVEAFAFETTEKVLLTESVAVGGTIALSLMCAQHWYEN